MRVDSSPGEGSAFTILLPAVTAPTAPSPEEAATVPTPSANSRRWTVLVVEDEDHVRALAVAVLEQEGYHVLGATNGRTALDAVAGAVGVVDVLVTDVVMPELGGVDLARELVRRQPQLAVVFMSGYTDRVLPELRPGEKPWLVEKPFQPGALARTVAEVLARADATV
jgi:two-component system cell cycle sensor histidine kinase/response regulator CckA